MHKLFNIAYFRSLERVPRQLSLAPRVTAIGDLRDKRQWEERSFDTCAFSFILRGNGRYRQSGHTWRVTAPCVLSQHPGDPIAYGPDGQWDEVFFVYSPERIPFFQQGGLLTDENPTWSIRNGEVVRGGLGGLFELLTEADLDQVIDSVDAACLKILSDSVAMPAVRVSTGDEAIRKLRAKIDEDLFAEWTTRGLSEQANMSVSTFRRHWLRCVGVSPQQYIIGRKMDMACQFLRHSDLRNAEIAQALHFDNYFYFSRLFKRKIGLSPTGFRRRGMDVGIRDNDGGGLC